MSPKSCGDGRYGLPAKLQQLAAGERDFFARSLPLPTRRTIKEFAQASERERA